MLSNPIILKEFLQAARQGRTYIFRAGLVVLAALFIGPELWRSLNWYGQDWRQISSLSRDVFETLSWIQIWVLPIVSFLLCSMTLREEWNNRTLEVLCASPLSRFQIVYGKFIAAVGKLALCALALLPIMALLLNMGRVPRYMAFSAFGLIVSTVFLLGALGLLQSAFYRPVRHAWLTWFMIIVPYFLFAFLAAVFASEVYDLDISVATLPPVVMEFILEDRSWRGFSPQVIAWIACGINTGVALLALILTPYFFTASLARHARPRRKSGKRLSFFRKLLAGSRPTWDAEEAGRGGEGPLLFLKDLGASLRDYPRMTGALGAIMVLIIGSITLTVTWTVSLYNYLQISWIVGVTGLAGLGLFYTLFIAEREEARRPIGAIRGAYRFFLYTILAAFLMIMFITYLEPGCKCLAWSGWPLQVGALALAPGAGALLGFAIRRAVSRFTIPLKRIVFCVMVFCITAGAVFRLGQNLWEPGVAPGDVWLQVLHILIPVIGWLVFALIMFRRGRKAAHDFDEAKAGECGPRAFRFFAKEFLNVFRTFRLGLVWVFLASGAVIIWAMLFMPLSIYNWFVIADPFTVFLASVTTITLGSWGGGFALGVLFGRCRLAPDPFVWQERGGPTVVLRRLPWVVYGIILLVAACLEIVGMERSFKDDDFYFGLLMTGLAMFGILSLFYGLMVFAREKSRHRAAALLLTGNPPWRFIWAKIRALYASLWIPLLSIPVLLLLFVHFGGFRYFDWGEEGILLLLLIEAVLFGPALCAVIGMAFGLASRGLVRAVLGLLSSAGWAFLLFWVVWFFADALSFDEGVIWLFLPAFAVGATVVVRAPRRLTPWHLGMSLAFQFYFVIFCMIGTAILLDELFGHSFMDDGFFLIISIVGSLATWLVCFGWLRIALRIFEQSMAGNAVSLRQE